MAAFWRYDGIPSSGESKINSGVDKHNLSLPWSANMTFTLYDRRGGEFRSHLWQTCDTVGTEP